jgi:mannitol-specific phosphotransferase system IIBC component
LANVSLVAACYWLVAGKGLLGAILAMLIAAIVQLLVSALILAAALRTKANVQTKTFEAA